MNHLVVVLGIIAIIASVFLSKWAEEKQKKKGYQPDTTPEPKKELRIQKPKKSVSMGLRRSLDKLNTPLKRTGFVAFIAGVFLMSIGLLHDDFYFDSESFFRSIEFSRRFGSVPAFGIGFYLTVAGLFTSFLFDYTLGPLIRWIKQGRK
ncbi:hypothetical protein [Klebsiella michiganensis]|uniref:hypothetical protein n=1 Tax=Klebsiella michiganensis TaxID=1134687 RepID=UPI0039C19FB0